MQPVTTLSAIVTKSLADADLAPADAGAYALAVSYARLIDESEALEGIIESVVPDDAAQQDILFKLQKRLTAHKVTAELGPKLLDVLTALGATPAGRSAVARKGSPVADAQPIRTAARSLAALRAERGGPGAH